MKASCRVRPATEADLAAIVNIIREGRDNLFPMIDYYMPTDGLQTAAEKDQFEIAFGQWIEADLRDSILSDRCLTLVAELVDGGDSVVVGVAQAQLWTRRKHCRYTWQLEHEGFLTNHGGLAPPRAPSQLRRDRWMEIQKQNLRMWKKMLVRNSYLCKLKVGGLFEKNRS
jgi:hypothetical protein